MNNDSRIGVFLCECGGKISSRIDLPQVRDLLQKESLGHLGIYPYPCLAPGLAAMQQEVRTNGLNRILVGGCASRVMKKRFTAGLAEAGIEKHQVELVNLKDHVARVHDAGPQGLARKATALLAGGIATLRLLEPYKPVAVPFEGPALILGGGISAFATARELARNGMESLVVSEGQNPDQVLELLPRTFPGSRIFFGEMAELLREVFTSPLVQVVPYQPIEYLIGGMGDYQLGMRQPDGSVTELTGVALVVALDREFDSADLASIGGGERVWDFLEMEKRLAEGRIKPGRLLFWINSPEHGKAAQEFGAVAAWRNSLVLAQKNSQVKPTVLYPANIAMPLTGADLAEARACGVGLMTYAPEVHPVVQSGYMTFISPKDGLEQEVEWDNLVVSAVPAEPTAKVQELLRWLPIYPEEGGRLAKSNVKLWPEDVPEESLFFSGSAGGICDLGEALQQGKKAARGVLRLREKARQGILVSPVVVTVDQDLCEGCGLCTEICPCGGIEHVKPGSGPVPREVDNHLCHGGGTCAAACPHEAIRVLNNNAQTLEARIKAMLSWMQEGDILGFVCSWGGLTSANQAGIKGLHYPTNVYLTSVNCLGSIDPVVLSMAFLSGAKGIMLAGCTPVDGCHYAHGVDHCWYRVNVVKKLLSLAGLDRRRIAMGYVNVNEPESFVRMVESRMESLEQLPPITRDDKNKAKLWAIHATLHRPRVRWVLGTSLRRPNDKVPGLQVDAVDADEIMVEVLQEEFLASRIFKALTGEPLNPRGLARALEEKVEDITPVLTEMEKDKRITLKRWEGGYPLYAVGKA